MAVTPAHWKRLSPLLDAALDLDPAEREALAEELLLSVGGAEREAIDAAWLAEARRRDAALLAGKTRVSPVDEVVGRLKANAKQQ